MHLQELSHEEAWAYYDKLLKDLLTVCQLPSIQQWPQLQDFLHNFARQRPGAVARSAMHIAITGMFLPLELCSEGIASRLPSLGRRSKTCHTDSMLLHPSTHLLHPGVQAAAFVVFTTRRLYAAAAKLLPAVTSVKCPAVIEGHMLLPLLC